MGPLWILPGFPWSPSVRKANLARIRFWAFRTPVGLVKPREQQLARPEAHHAMRVDHQRFTGTRITPLPFALFFDGEYSDSSQFHTLAALQRTGDLIQHRDDQAFGLGASSKPRPVVFPSISLETLIDAADELRSGEAFGQSCRARKTRWQVHKRIVRALIRRFDAPFYPALLCCEQMIGKNICLEWFVIHW